MIEAETEGEDNADRLQVSRERAIGRDGPESEAYGAAGPRPTKVYRSWVRFAHSPFRPVAVSLVFPHPMKSYRKELWFETKKRREFIRITPQINQCLRESGIEEGLLLVNAMHITASVFINDNESGLHRDFEVWLEKLAPERPYDQYAHNGAEDNADAHLKRTVMGREVVVAVTEGKLDFGPWEEIFYGEFDGRRRKRVLVKIIGE